MDRDRSRNLLETKPDVSGGGVIGTSSSSSSSSVNTRDGQERSWESNLYYPSQSSAASEISYMYGSHTSSREAGSGRIPDIERLHGGMRSAPGEVSSSSLMSSASPSLREDIQSPDLPEYALLTSANDQDFNFSQSLALSSDVTGLSSSTKHMCAICGDRASGKHYGVYR